MDFQEKAASRVVFLDYLRVIACFMVMAIHSAEPYYLGGAEGTYVATRLDAFWVTVVECLCRVCVPLFVMASAYLLFPVKRPTGEFFRRRLVRVVVPFVLWSAVYVLRFDGSWSQLLFNFPDSTGGHLWFVPMLLGLYLLMPLLSPWAERVSEKELLIWLLVWLFTTTFPYLRRLWGALYGDPSFGAVPYLYGECPWNMFGTFQYVSGFVGYLLLGFWFRKFAAAWSWRKSLASALPLGCVGVALVGGLFFFRIPNAFPYSAPYARAVDLEMSIEYCSLGVALCVLASFIVFRKFSSDGWLYAHVVRPLSEASYGTYLVHMLVLAEVIARLQGKLPTPLAILASAALSFVTASLFSVAVRKIPVVGKWICG